MSSVRVKENEPFDVALRRFKRLIEKTGLLNDLRAREFYEKPTWERKRNLLLRLNVNIVVYATKRFQPNYIKPAGVNCG